ncbi:MAG TPA: hypothetical protein VNK52_10395 [Hyphomicrobiaceae bacterium]|nr:hypothetical protein [Hyphomicrobiaceae bacterium]
MQSRTLACLLVFAATTTAVQAATITARSCSATDVQRAIAAAEEGDTVAIPAGRCTWTSPVHIINKGLTLRGAGVGQTVITNGYAADEVLQIHLQAGDPTTYVTAFTIDAALQDTGSNGVMVLVGGGMNQFRIHHMEILNLVERGIIVAMDGEQVSGLIDHVTFSMPGARGGSKAISILGTGPEEHQPFTRPFELGSSHFIFIEDCTFNYGGQNDGALDAYGGARYVFRHNVVNNTNVEHHGADSGSYRGVHSFEIYANTFVCLAGCAPQRKHYFRSGSGVIFNNRYFGNYRGMDVTNYRSDEEHPPWGRCDGSSPWDENRPGESGYPCLDQIGHVFGPRPGGKSTFQGLYEWGNTHDGRNVDISVSGQNAHIHIKVNRDFFNDTVRPGYVPYAYPHPLQGSGPDSGAR